MMPLYSSPKPWGPLKKGVARVANLVLLVSYLVASGCSPAGGGQVTGSVLLDGKPLTDAYLGFFPKGQMQPTNLAVSDAAGNFEVTRDRAKRTLPPGTYIVVVRKYVKKDGKPPPSEQRELFLLSGQLHNMLPERYNSPTTTDLAVEIKPGDNALPPLELKSR